MDPVASVEVVAGQGLVGNANQGGRRQVTLMEEELWQGAMEEMESQLPPWIRRANLMVSGVSLKKRRGDVLEIGSCRLQIMGETKPCERMDEALSGLKKALYREWRGGVFATVLSGGTLRVGDPVVLRSANGELWPE